jgi:hypothetical protein
LSAQTFILIALLGTDPVAPAPNFQPAPWMVGSTLSSDPPAGPYSMPATAMPGQPAGIAPAFGAPPPAVAPWPGNASVLPPSTPAGPGQAVPDMYGLPQPPREDFCTSLVHFFFPPADQTLAGFYDPFTRQFAYGSAGVQSYRLGWLSYDDFVYMPRAGTNGVGHFSDVEWNTWLRYSQLVQQSMVFAWTASFNGHWWTGPSGITFPPDGTQLVSDFQLSSYMAGPWNWQLGVTPQINSDFERSLDSNAFMIDGRAVVFFRASPQWLFAAGAAFWNRATDHVIPYAGIIWSPNDRWEFRLLYPRARISYYTGNFWGFETWGYVSLDYNIEAYQMNFTAPHTSVRGELSDYRFLKGFNFERGRWNFFWEAGAVFDRHVRFRGPVDDFRIHEGLIIRTGLTY